MVSLSDVYFTICAINVWNHLYHFEQFICHDRECIHFAIEMSLILKRDLITIKFVEMPSASDICELYGMSFG